MTADFTPQDRQRFDAVQQYWREQFGDVNFIPESYQFLMWLRRYDYRTVKTAIRITASWVHRKLARCVTHGEDLPFGEEGEGIVAYCSAVARNTDQAKADAAALQRQSTGTAIASQG